MTIIFIPTIKVESYKLSYKSLVHTVLVFSPGVATVWTPGPNRDNTVATPVSTALNRDAPC